MYHLSNISQSIPKPKAIVVHTIRNGEFGCVKEEIMSDLTSESVQLVNMSTRRNPE